MTSLLLTEGNRPYFATAALIGLSFYAWYSFRSNGSENKIDYDGSFELLDSESSGIIYIPGISTISFYTGDISSNNQLKYRFLEVMKRNPWLAGHLLYVKDPITKTNKLKTVYKSKFPEETIDKFYQEIVIEGNDSTGLKDIDEKTPIEKVKALVQQYFVKSGYECINRPKEPLIYLLILKFIDNDNLKVKKSALFFSFSHTLGDGHTYYTLLSSLNITTNNNEDSSITNLIAERNLSFDNKINEIYGKEYEQFFQTKFLFSLFCNIFFRSKPMIHRYIIDKKKIQAIKQAYNSTNTNNTSEKIDQPIIDEGSEKNNNTNNNNNYPQQETFLSTNDILTSWFFKVMKSSYGFMAVNYRNRLKDYTHNHAGNYEGLIHFHERDYQSPCDIRKAVTTLKSKTKQIPTWLESIQGDFSVITNWASFYKPLVFPDCELLLHTPIIDERDLVVNDLMIVYQSNIDELSITLLTRKKDIPFHQLFL
eukprot:gene2370-2517_t